MNIKAVVDVVTRAEITPYEESSKLLQIDDINIAPRYGSISIDIYKNKSFEEEVSINIYSDNNLYLGTASMSLDELAVNLSQIERGDDDLNLYRGDLKVSFSAMLEAAAVVKNIEQSGASEVSALLGRSNRYDVDIKDVSGASLEGYRVSVSKQYGSFLAESNAVNKQDLLVLLHDIIEDTAQVVHYRTKADVISSTEYFQTHREIDKEGYGCADDLHNFASPYRTLFDPLDCYSASYHPYAERDGIDKVDAYIELALQAGEVLVRDDMEYGKWTLKVGELPAVDMTCPIIEGSPISLEGWRDNIFRKQDIKEQVETFSKAYKGELGESLESMIDDVYRKTAGYYAPEHDRYAAMKPDSHGYMTFTDIGSLYGKPIYHEVNVQVTEDDNGKPTVVCNHDDKGYITIGTKDIYFELPNDIVKTLESAVEQIAYKELCKTQVNQMSQALHSDDVDYKALSEMLNNFNQKQEKPKTSIKLKNKPDIER